MNTNGQTPKHEPTLPRRKRGFEMASGLVQAPIRKASEARGFSEHRLLTHWVEVVGDEIAQMGHPVKISYAKGGFGATLTLLTTGAFAPMLQAELPRIREKVNAVYGYNAISRVHITQTSPTGFAKGRAAFLGRNDTVTEPQMAELEPEARIFGEGVADEGLKAAIEDMARDFLRKKRTTQKEAK